MDNILEDMSEHAESAFCHSSKIPETISLYREKVFLAPSCRSSSLWSNGPAALDLCSGNTCWWACMVEQIAYTINLRQGRRRRRAECTNPSESMSLDLKTSHLSPMLDSTVSSACHPGNQASSTWSFGKQYPNCSRCQGRLNLKKRFGVIFWQFFWLPSLWAVTQSVVNGVYGSQLLSSEWQEYCSCLWKAFLHVLNRNPRHHKCMS